jgi:protein-disulfide isomerase
MSKLVQPVGPNDHVLGSDDAPVTLVEYGDYERAYRVVGEVMRRLGDSVRLAYRHFPLTQVHPHAQMAAQAAEAAGAQDRFWRMHSMLFEHQDALEPEDLLSYAEAIDLDVVRFAQDLRQEIHLPKVLADFRSGVRSGVNGTPTFFINGERFDLPWDPETLTAAIAQAA